MPTDICHNNSSLAPESSLLAPLPHKLVAMFSGLLVTGILCKEENSEILPFHIIKERTASKSTDNDNNQQARLNLDS
jgi:hypothetical protein